MLVHDDPVVEGVEARGAGQVDPRGDTDADDDDIGGFDLATVEHDRRPAAAAQLDDTGPEPQPDAVVGVQAPEHLPHLVTEDPVERHRAGVDEDDVGAHLPCGGRHLRSDPPGADHGHAVGAVHSVAEAAGVAELTEVVDSGQVGAGHVEAARCGTGRQDRR